MPGADEIFVSVDVETDGPIPGPHSMLSLGAVAFRVSDAAPGETGWLRFGTFSANLSALPGARQDPGTMAWWKKNPEAWARATENPQPPEKAMASFSSWLEGLPGKPAFVGWPASWDFMFVFWYLMNFTGKSPFSHSGLCLKSIACDRLGLRFRDMGKKDVPRRWFADCPEHNHDALVDALEQGIMWMNMREERETHRPEELGLMPEGAGYAIIQWCPDPGRKETANIGVALNDPETGHFCVRTDKDFTRVRRFFPETDFSRIEPAEEAFVHGLMDVAGRSPDLIPGWIARQANEIRMTPFRPTNVRGTPSEEVDALFAELVL